MTGTAVTPSRAEFIELAKLHTVVPVWTQILADLETPVAAFIKLVERMVTHWCSTGRAHQLERSDTHSSPVFVLGD